MATKAEVRDRAGVDLGLIALNQGLQSQDVTRIEAAYSEVYADLKSDGLAVWGSTAEIPAEMVPHIAALMCRTCLLTYGVSVERRDRILLMAGKDGETAKREIKKLIQPDYASQESAQDF